MRLLSLKCFRYSNVGAAIEFMQPSYQGPEGWDIAICVVLDNPDVLSYNLTVSLLP